MHTREPAGRKDAMDELRERLEKGQYEIDSRQVASSLVSKIGLMQTVRRHLVEAGQSQGPSTTSL